MSTGSLRAPRGYLSEARFEELHEACWRVVFALCRSRLGDREEALDATRDVFLRKWRARHGYDPERASFLTWVRRNAERVCIDRLRRRAVRGEPQELPDDLPAENPPGAESDRALTRVVVGQALDRLGDQQRQLVLMHKVEGYTWEEIAADTGLTVAQARERVAKALDALRSFLRQLGIAVDM